MCGYILTRLLHSVGLVLLAISELLLVDKSTLEAVLLYVASMVNIISCYPIWETYRLVYSLDRYIGFHTSCRLLLVHLSARLA